VSVRDYLAVLRRRRRLIAICVLVGVLLGLGYAAFAPRKWNSTAQVVVRPVNQSLTEASSVGPDKLLTMSTEQQVASSGDVALAARRILHSPDTAEQLLQRVSVSNPAGTVVLVFQFTGSSARAAQEGAEAFATAYLAQRRTRYAEQVTHETSLIDKQLAALNGQSGTSGQRAALIQQRSQLLTLDTTPGSFNQNATLPIAPSSPNSKLGLAVCGFLGLFVGILAAFARDATDPRLRDGTDLAERLGRPTLAELPPVGRRGGARMPAGLLLTDAPDSQQAAALRLLRSRLLVAGIGGDCRVVLITSPRRTGGKSVIAANVAAGLAEAGRSVRLVTVDPLAPSPRSLFGVKPSAVARATLLAESRTRSTVGEEIRLPAWESGGELHVLRAAAGAGVSPFISGTLGRLLQPRGGRPLWQAEPGTDAVEASDGADVVVLDCPPLLDESDALTAVQHADLVLVVVDRATRRADVGRVGELLAEAGARVLGGVFDRSGVRAVSGQELPAKAGPATFPGPTGRSAAQRRLGSGAGSSGTAPKRVGAGGR
jgi:capsular polysaccharide biosynthesis protein